MKKRKGSILKTKQKSARTSAKKPVPARVLTKKNPALPAVKTTSLVVDKRIYPIGKYTAPTQYTEQLRKKQVQEIGALPDLLRAVEKKIKNKKLQNRYREGGWTIEQLVHHLADSHLNAYIRFKLALTEKNPTIKPYDENLWAETADVQSCTIKDSIRIIRGLHKRWLAMLENMSNDDWKRTYFHPEHKRKISLEEALSQYAWHGKHHLAQIQVALKTH